MTDPFRALAEIALGHASVLGPRPRSRFEPDALGDELEERDEEAAAGRPPNAHRDDELLHRASAARPPRGESARTPVPEVRSEREPAPDARRRAGPETRTRLVQTRHTERVVERPAPVAARAESRTFEEPAPASPPPPPAAEPVRIDVVAGRQPHEAADEAGAPTAPPVAEPVRRSQPEVHRQAAETPRAQPTARRAPPPVDPGALRPPQPRARAERAPEAAPVHITIDRVEVQAVVASPAPGPPPPRTPTPAPGPSLAEYLEDLDGQ